MTNPIQQVNQLGQSFWYDNIRRAIIKSGELGRLIEMGLSGLTSNPTIFEKAIAGSTDYDEALVELAESGKNVDETYEALVIEDIRGAADLLRPTYDRTAGADGYASLEVSPHLAHDTEGTVAEAERLFAALDRPNVMVKVPGTPEGIPAVRRLIGEGININTTLIFSLDAYRGVREAYIGGLEDLAVRGGDVSKVASVASFFVSRVDTAVDTLLEERINDGRQELKGLLGKAAVANAKVAYKDFKGDFGSGRFNQLREKGARVQRPLWASTSVKNPAYSDVLYVESLIGADTVNTMPEVTLTAFLEQGRADNALEQDIEGAEQTLASLEEVGISMEEVTGKLLADGVKAFADSYDQLVANIAEKRADLLAHRHEPSGVSIGEHLPGAEAALDDLDRRDLVGRIWRKDHTVWKPDPEEICDRLGWLTVTDIMGEQVSDLEAFADEVRSARFQHVVLLGMGGSSLGPAVLRQTFDSADGYPELIVLDSTVPAWVQAVTEAIDPARTLFLVSSKSGTTIEPNSLYKHFRGLAAQVIAEKNLGQSFVAITDPGTPLERLARGQAFRRVFINPSDLGGRYSVLSYFGLVPAALMGINLAELLDRADSMRKGCASSVSAHDNPGARLGAVMGSLALSGRDKLTLVTSPSIEGFALWAEQLISESTGKDGKGIVPVAGKPLLAPEHYGDDRLFVYLRLESDPNADTDAAVDGIESSGQPVVRLGLRDKYDLGAEFYRWEFATAVAGAVLGVHPFDQPNVQQAKDLTARVLHEYHTSGAMPPSVATDSFGDLLSKARPGDYLALMAYVHQTPEMDEALSDLRREVMRRHRIAATLGYGPRFLHSTGQLNKGGPETGLFLQITADHEKDIPISGESYSFGVLADAQAMGDLRALQALGRPVARVSLGNGGPSAIKSLVNELGT